MRSTDLLRRYLDILDEAPVVPVGASAAQPAAADPAAAQPGAQATAVGPDPQQQAKMAAQQALDRKNQQKAVDDQIKQTQDQLAHLQKQLQDLQKQKATLV